MADLRELYQEVIFDHSKHPRNFHPIVDATRKAQGANPLCGDKLTVYLKLNGDFIEDVSFEGCGCAISTASASLMTESMKGKTISEVQHLFEAFHHAVTDEHASAHDELGKLKVLCGVREFPARVKCATLAWHTLQAALNQQQGLVSTE
jgi:nitrogen fixation protein NifU and related proteins